MRDAQDVVIVTGSSGFIGSAVIEKFAERFRLVGFDREISPHPPPAAECVCIDLTSDASVEAAFHRVHMAYGARIASVIHLAAYFDLTGEPNPKYEEITVRGTERLLHALQSFKVEQFVFASTMLVHAPSMPGRRIAEESPFDAKLPYRESKIRTERLIHDQRGRIPALIVRPAGVYDDLCHATFLAHQIGRIYERRLISHVYPGDVNAGQSFLHLDDLTAALLCIVERRKDLPLELALLLGEPETLSFDEIQRLVGRLIHDEAWETRQISKSLARTGAWVEGEVLDEDPFIKPWMVDIADEHYELDISRARKLLGWKPEHSLRRALPKMVAALKADPAGWYRANKLDAAKVAADSIKPQQSEKPRKEDPVAHHEMMRKHDAEMRSMHFDMLWVHFLNILLGAWLATSPFVFGTFYPESFSDAVLRVTAERSLWDPALRSSLTAWSDLFSGLAIMLFGALSLSQRFAWAQWANTGVGLWLLFAPLIFWSPSAAVYANDTFVGALVITFAILVPMMPGMSHEGMMDSSDKPLGWTYSPSTYLQRLPIVALGAFGFFIARTLAAYQLGHIDGVWEPFFSGEAGRNGTEFIITSQVSKAWPIADGGLGAVTYMLEVLMGVMGDRSRWRTMPWMVAMFGIVVVPLGVVSIYFIIIQPIVIGTYCSLCLLAALAMLIMIPYSLDELVAMGQFLVQSHRRGEPFWRTFFMGGADPNGGRDDKPDFGAPLAATVASAVRGVTVPWTLVASTIVGIWLMFSRISFGTVPPLADSDHLVGALIITVAVIAMAEVGRALRFVNVAFGLWLIAAPWLLSGAGSVASWASVVAGVVVIMLSLPRGPLSKEHYGGWDRYVV
ncbi:MAG TPA: NAD-dependent epimerase/dehydratase family protein [Thermoanaerobaculia bacterium]